MKSANRKTGKIPVSITEEKSCPKECPLKNTDCYARFSYLGLQWRNVPTSKNKNNWSGFCLRVKKFAVNQLWRHNQSGDLPKLNNKLDAVKCEQLSKASEHTRGWTYTHFDPTNQHNKKVIQKMNAVSGMTVNLSADNLKKADEYVKLGIGTVVVTLPEDTPHRGNKTPKGVQIVICPAQTQDDMNCEQCKLCQIRDRKSVVGFLAHGTTKKRLSRNLKTSWLSKAGNFWI